MIFLQALAVMKLDYYISSEVWRLETQLFSYPVLCSHVGFLYCFWKLDQDVKALYHT